MTTKKKTKNSPTSIFAFVHDDNSVTYHRTLEEIQKYMEREIIEEGVILEVIKVIEASFPPEPELEFIDRELKDYL